MGGRPHVLFFFSACSTLQTRTHTAGKTAADSSQRYATASTWEGKLARRAAAAAAVSRSAGSTATMLPRRASKPGATGVPARHVRGQGKPPPVHGAPVSRSLCCTVSNMGTRNPSRRPARRPRTGADARNHDDIVDLCGEWRLAAQHDPQDRAHTIHVNLDGVACTALCTRLGTCASLGSATRPCPAKSVPRAPYRCGQRSRAHSTASCPCRCRRAAPRPHSARGARCQSRTA